MRTKAELTDFYARKRAGLVSPAEVRAAGVFLCCVSATRRNAKYLAMQDIQAGLELLAEVGIYAPPEITTGYGFSLVERVAAWVRENVPEAREVLA